MQQRLTALTKDFYNCASMKAEELKRKRSDLEKLIKKGDYPSVLTIISEHLTLNSADGIFPG